MVNLILSLERKPMEEIVEEPLSHAIIGSQSRKIEDLPPEVIQEIFLRLPITSVSESRFVCHNWHRLVNDPRLADMHSTRACRGKSPPGLIMHSPLVPGEFSDVYFVPDIGTCPKAIKLKNLPFKSWLPTFVVAGSCNGFLCFVDNTLTCPSIFISNPVTGEYTRVPDNLKCGHNYGFGFDSKNKAYKVVRIRYPTDPKDFEVSHDMGENELVVEVHTLGTSSWRTVGHVIRTIGRRSNGTLLNGSLHWLGFHADDLDVNEEHDTDFVNVIAVSLADEEVQLFSPPPVVSQIYSYCHLGVLEGRLIMVDDCDDEHVDLWVMQDYGIKDSWTKYFVISRPVGPELCLDSRYFWPTEVYFRTDLSFRPLLMQDNGQILVECNRRALVSYDPRTRSYKDLKLTGLPIVFAAVPHISTLAPLKHIMEGKEIFIEDEDQQRRGWKW